MAAPATKDRYHHGDLRKALIDAAVAVARVGGPDAVVVRDVARQVGVSHNAGYRHFASRDDLLAAVADRGLAELARAMESGLAATPSGPDPCESARERLQVVGRSYVQYARQEPGMFRTMWTRSGAPGGDGTAASHGDGGRDAFEILGAVLDELVAVGVLAPSRRPDSDAVAWSVVHGLSSLLIDGPLRGSTDEDVERVMVRLFDIVQHGLG